MYLNSTTWEKSVTMNMNFMLGSGCLSIQGWTKARISLGVHWKHNHVLYRESAITQSPSGVFYVPSKNKKNKGKQNNLTRISSMQSQNTDMMPREMNMTMFIHR